MTGGFKLHNKFFYSLTPEMDTKSLNEAQDMIDGARTGMYSGLAVIAYWPIDDKVYNYREHKVVVVAKGADEMVRTMHGIRAAHDAIVRREKERGRPEGDLGKTMEWIGSGKSLCLVPDEKK